MMLEWLAPVLAAVLLWWASTGAILYLDGLPTGTFRWSLLAVTALGAVAFVGAHLVRDDATAYAAYVGFVSGLMIWAVPTAAFYFGAVTGPRRAALAPDVAGWPRFRAACATMLHHELLCLGLAAALLLLLIGASNKLALWTYLMLWAMHVSGKLNMYFGVPNLSEEFLPRHLAYLETYMRRRPMNLLFPLSITFATAAALAFAYAAWRVPAASFDAIAYTLLAVLALLAVVEHWLLVLPVAPMALWSWSLRSRRWADHDAVEQQRLFPNPAFDPPP